MQGDFLSFFCLAVDVWTCLLLFCVLLYLCFFGGVCGIVMELLLFLNYVLVNFALTLTPSALQNAME